MWQEKLLASTKKGMTVDTKCSFTLDNILPIFMTTDLDMDGWPVWLTGLGYKCLCVFLYFSYAVQKNKQELKVGNQITAHLERSTCAAANVQEVQCSARNVLC